MEQQFNQKTKHLTPTKEKSEENAQITFFNEFEKKILGILGTFNPSVVSDVDKNRLAFDKLVQNPAERSRLENIHAARGHRYGTAHLGPKSWYQNTQNLSLKVKTHG